MNLKTLFPLCFLVCLLVSPATQAKVAKLPGAQQERDWAAQRAAYRQALQLLYKGDRQRFREEAAKLQDYPLYPDLLFHDYSRHLSTLTKKEVDAFRKAYGDSVLAARLHRLWIQTLADRKDWKTYLAEYRPGQFGDKYDCYYYWAHYQVGSRDTAFSGARKLWLVNKSQDKACDPLFGVWRSTGQIDGALAWERMRMAMDAGQLQLATHLESYLPASQKPLAREWRELYRDPSRLANLGRYQAWGAQAKPLIKTGFARLIRQKAELALQLWPRYEQAFAFNMDEKSVILKEMAFVLGANYAEHADYWLSQALQYEPNQSLAPLAVRNALRKKDWSRVRALIALVGEEAHSEAEWRYWIARSTQQIPTLRPHRAERQRPFNLVEQQDAFFAALYDRSDFFTLLPESVLQSRFLGEDPQQTYQSLAEERHYYGFVSAERLGQPLNLRQNPQQVSEEELQRLLRHPGVLRARELYLLGEIPSSRAQWHYTINQLDERDRGVAAYLAHLWDWNHSAIMAAARSSAHDDLYIRFPTAHKELVIHYARKYAVDPDWVYAVIRQESAFLPNARSPVGALGFMQIMPATAKQLARNMRIAQPSTHQLTQPETNIAMGVFYLKQLLEEFGGNMILATASYNAGPHRARAWQPRYGAMEGDIWVDTIPFRETREYVKNILAYQAIYRHHLGFDVSLNQALAAIPPRQVTATAQR